MDQEVFTLVPKGKASPEPVRDEMTSCLESLLEKSQKPPYLGSERCLECRRNVDLRTCILSEEVGVSMMTLHVIMWHRRGMSPSEKNQVWELIGRFGGQELLSSKTSQEPERAHV